MRMEIFSLIRPNGKITIKKVSLDFNKYFESIFGSFVYVRNYALKN